MQVRELGVLRNLDQRFYQANIFSSLRSVFFFQRKCLEFLEFSEILSKRFLGVADIFNFVNMESSRRRKIVQTPLMCKFCLRGFRFISCRELHEEECTIRLPSFSNVVYLSTRKVERTSRDQGSSSEDEEEEEDKKLERELRREVKDTDSELSDAEDPAETDFLRDPSNIRLVITQNK